MIRSLYDGAAAMHVINLQHEQISNNLANVNTGGFRKAMIAVRNNTQTPIRLGAGPEVDRKFIDFSQGRLVDSRRDLDFALSGDAFFTLQDSAGAEYYTKNGRFYRDRESSELVTDAGLRVIGKNGPIKVPNDIPDSLISVGPDGTIIANENSLGKFAIVAFENNESLIPVGQSNFRRGNNTVDADVTAQVRQYFHEVSNINPTSELIGLITGGRHYEAIQKATRAISESLQQSIRG